MIRKTAWLHWANNFTTKTQPHSGGGYRLRVTGYGGHWESLALLNAKCQVLNEVTEYSDATE